YGFSGSRSSTGGSPMLSSIGACWYLPGLATGFDSEPTACEPLSPCPPCVDPPPPEGVQLASATDPASTAEPYRNERREKRPRSIVSSKGSDVCVSARTSTLESLDRHGFATLSRQPP